MSLARPSRSTSPCFGKPVSSTSVATGSGAGIAPDRLAWQTSGPGSRRSGTTGLAGSRRKPNRRLAMSDDGPLADMTDGVIEREIRIEAPPRIVFGFFTDPERLARWMGRTVTLDASPGGAVRI